MTSAPAPEERARERINEQLSEAGWKNLDEEPGHTGFKTEFPTDSGPVDYALLINGDPFGVIEAKKAVEESAFKALPQAKRYAKDIDAHHDYGEYNVPFVFTANGDEIFIQDVRPEGRRERKLAEFHSPDGLQNILRLDYAEAKDWLRSTPVEETDSGLWDNQSEAIQNVEQGLLDNKQRMLVQMATGTGKTRMAAALVYRLLKADYANSVLFLVDRTELGDQAASEFENYDIGRGRRLEEVYEIEQVENGIYPEDATIVISTIQSMYSFIEKREDVDIPIHAFDFVISDECHRSIYNDWKVVLNHFDSVQLGLTATPAEHTLAYFGGESNWVYQYSYRQAVEDGHVVPYEAYRIETGITMRGLYYEGEEYDPEDLERKITVPDTTRTIAEEFRDRSEDGQKTLIFTRGDDHAVRVERIFREVFSDKPDDYVQKITHTTDTPGEKIDRFRNPGLNPTIAVTVDMVSTGVDVKPIENLIFIRPTRSAVLYNQMVGRGTRTCEDIDKEKFTIYDCIGIVDWYDHEGVGPFNTYTSPDEKEGDDGSGSSGGSGTSGNDDEIVVADDVMDKIEYSGYIFETEDGRRLNQDEYQEAFEEFVREHRDDIEAIQTILNEPEMLTREQVQNLSERLREEPEKFTEERLQRAYKEEMTDIIGFVKHALGEGLMTTEERVERAFDAWLQETDMSFTQEQRRWLNQIKEHFKQEEKITREDFQWIPFSRMGGWTAATEAFGGEDELADLLDELNEEVILA
jgi:type I restriction enzyme R subunit